MTIASPAAGTWVVLVDGFAVPTGSTQYDYVDVFTNAAFGSIAVNDANAPRPAGSTWTVSGAVTPTRPRPLAACCLAGSRPAPTRMCSSAPET